MEIENYIPTVLAHIRSYQLYQTTIFLISPCINFLSANMVLKATQYNTSPSKETMNVLGSTPAVYDH